MYQHRNPQDFTTKRSNDARQNQHKYFSSSPKNEDEKTLPNQLNKANICLVPRTHKYCVRKSKNKNSTDHEEYRHKQSNRNLFNKITGN